MGLVFLSRFGGRRTTFYPKYLQAFEFATACARLSAARRKEALTREPEALRALQPRPQIATLLPPNVMNTYVLSLLSLLPILTVALFLVILRWPAARAMPLSYIVAVALALLVWRVPGVQVAAASVNGLIVAGTLLYIIFGAILLLNTLKESGALRTIRQGFINVTPIAVFKSSSLPGSSVHSSKAPLGSVRPQPSPFRFSSDSASPRSPRSWPA